MKSMKPSDELLVYGVLFNGVRMLVGAFSALYLIGHGMHVAEIGLLKTVQAVVILVLDIPLAYVADRQGRKASVVLAAVFGALWLGICGLAPTPPAFYFAEVMNAISLALFGGAFISALVEAAKNENGDVSGRRVLGRYYKWTHVGMAIAALVGTAFISVESSVTWVAAGVSMAVLALLGMVGSRLELPGRPAEGTKRTIREDLRMLRRGWSGHLGGLLVAFSLMFILVSAFHQILIQFWQVLAKTGLPDTSLAVPYGVLFATILLAQTFAGYIAERVEDIRRVLQFGIGLLGLSSLVLLSGATWYPPLILVSIPVYFCAGRIMHVVAQGVVLDCVDPSLRATYDSVLSTAVRFVLLVLLPTAGYLIDKSASLTMLSGGLLVGIAVLVLRTGRGHVALKTTRQSAERANS